MDGTHSDSDNLLSTLAVLVKGLSPGLSREKRKTEENVGSFICIHLSGPSSVVTTGLVCRLRDTDRSSQAI